MKRVLRYGLLNLLILLFSLHAQADDDLAKVDTLHRQGGLENYRQCIRLCLKALEADPDNFEANWRCARAYRQYGEEAKRQNLEGWKDICAEYGKAGMRYGQKALELEPDRPEGHYYYGLSAGIYSDAVSILTALAEGLKNKTRNSFEKAYELDKMLGDAGPILALGRFWAVVPWPYRDRKKALRYYREYQQTTYFEKKDEGKIYLAEVLLHLKGEENRAEAKSLLQKAAGSEEKYFRDWAKRLLREWRQDESDVTH